jgi:hypothetical protein
MRAVGTQAMQGSPQGGQAKWSIRYAEASTPPALGLFVVEIRDPPYRMQVRNDAHAARVKLALIAHTAFQKVVRSLLRTVKYGELGTGVWS